MPPPSITTWLQDPVTSTRQFSNTATPSFMADSFRSASGFLAIDFFAVWLGSWNGSDCVACQCHYKSKYNSRNILPRTALCSWSRRCRFCSQRSAGKSDAIQEMEEEGHPLQSARYSRRSIQTILLGIYLFSAHNTGKQLSETVEAWSEFGVAFRRIINQRQDE